MRNFFSRFFDSQPKETHEISEFAPYINAAQVAIQRQAWDEALMAYERGLMLARQRVDLRAQQYFLSGQGTVQFKARRYEQAENAFNDALALAQQLDDSILTARSYINLGEVIAARKQWDKAQTYHQKALDTARLTQDTPTIILAQEKLARAYMEQDNPAYANHLLREAVTAAQRSRDARAGASALGWWGRALILSGQKAQGRRHLENAQRLAMQTGREGLALQWVMALANLDLEEQNYHAAIERYLAAEALARHVGHRDKEFYIELALNLSNAYRQIGKYADAKVQAERALMHSRETGEQSKIALAFKEMGLAFQNQNEHEAAIEHLKQVLVYYEDGTLAEGKDEILLALGKSQQRLNQVEDAESTYQQALLLSQQMKNPLREAEALHWLGTLQNDRQNREEAVSLWHQAIRIFEDQGEMASAARVLCDLGNAHRIMGDLSAARTDFENALMHLNTIDDRVTRGLVFSNAANLYTQLGDMETAEAFYNDSIKIARELHDARSEGIRTGNLAWFYVLTGRAHRAIELFKKSLDISKQLKDTLLTAIQTNNMGYAYARLGVHDTATQLYNDALQAVDSLNSRRWKAVFQSNLGESLVAIGRLEEARTLYEEAMTLSDAMGDQENAIRTRNRLAVLFIQQGNLLEAQQLAETASQDARRMGYRKGQADAARALGDVSQQQNDLESARRYYGEAHKIYTMIQDPAAQDLAEYAR